MRKEKQQAILLRKQGQSYAQIGKKLSLSKSTLSLWLKNVELSKSARKILEKRIYTKSTDALIKRNKQQTFLAAERAIKIRECSKKEVSLLIKNSLFLAGISLYWAEGYKKGAEGSKWKSVDFANSDPKMILVMMRFFREICKVPNEKFRAQLIAHENVDIDVTVGFWSKLTDISKENFIKTSLPKKSVASNKRKGNHLTYGTIHIRINDVGFFYKMIGWIDGIKEYFLGL